MEIQSKKKHPGGLYVLFFTEMWERFSYYGMRAIFALFMVKALLFDKDIAGDIYGSYTGLVYLTPLLGGYMADRYWGNRRSIFIGGLMMALGQFLMFASGLTYENLPVAKLFMYFGLATLIFGNGFFKPNISTMVGSLYPKGDYRVDGAFTIFYMGINLGAFFAPLVCGGLGDTGNPADFKWGFLAAGIGMLISVVTFEILKNKYIVSPEGEPIGMPKKKVNEDGSAREKTAQLSKSQLGVWGIIYVVLFGAIFFLMEGHKISDPSKIVGVCIGAFIYSSMVVIPGLIISDKSLTAIEKQRIWVIFILAFFVIFFWSAFEQAGASLTFFADEQTDRLIHIPFFGDKEIPASFFQSINPLAIIAFAPLFAILWAKLGSARMEPPSPLKMALGLFLLSLGYLIIAFGVKGVAPGVKVSMMWIVTMYLLHTFGELCLSPIGLSMVSKLAPAKFASLLMGTWFLANAAANKLAGALTGFYPDPSKPFPHIFGFEITGLYSFFMIFVVMSGIASLILFLLHKRLGKMMHGVH